MINNEPLTVGQAVRFHLYEDRAGLGAEQCYAIAWGAAESDVDYRVDREAVWRNTHDGHQTGQVFFMLA